MSSGPVARLDRTPLDGAHLGPLPDERYTLEIDTGGGDRVVLRDFVSLDVTLRHTAISSWSAVVPSRFSLGDRTLSRVRLKWGGTHLFNGVLQDVSFDLNSPSTTIAGEGVGATLTRDDLTLDFRNITFWRAIRDTWARTDFDATVIPPKDDDHPANQRIGVDTGNGGEGEDDGDYSGTAMEILKALHENCGMRFTILHSRPGQVVESYPAGARRRRHDWDVLSGSRDQSSKGYANRVVVVGALKTDGSGDRYRDVAADDAEIEAMADRGLGTNQSGAVTYRVEDDSLNSAEKVQAKARSTLSELVDTDSVGGSLDVSPVIATPGAEYAIPSLSGERSYGTGIYGTGDYGPEIPEYATLTSVHYSISFGDVACSLDLSQRNGLATTLIDAIDQR